ncbi:glycerol transporter [Coemansia javaensis]|uniref:Glycerol transporter n=1 Tax=Coemansia javaensis TaxID=2761396 RepID=A0A9W8H937_9FUNG|nr:glycerol transporter [Coemansia javaensis]
MPGGRLPEHAVHVGSPAAPGDALSHTVLLSALGTHQQQEHSSHAAVDMPRDAAKAARPMRAPLPSRLSTLEFRAYYLTYLLVVPNMAYTVFRASSPARPEYAEYEHELSDGWLLGRKVDLSDGQWRTFRSHLPAFSAAMLAFVALSWAARWALRGRTAAAAGALPALWLPWAFATAFVVVLSGASIAFVAALAAGNYALARRVAGRRWAPAAIWAYNMLMLFSNEHFRGYRFGAVHEGLAWLDSHRGLLRRWDITFNLTMLRMVSFAIDHHWSTLRRQSQSQSPPPPLQHQARQTAKERVEQPCRPEEYCFFNYWAYILYPPLYLTGPIITFNDFVAQMRRPTLPALRPTLAYGARLVASYLLMELVLHTVYSVAISKWGHWDSFSAYEISLFGYMRLTFIWLKLLIIWRFARFWAMADGLETVDNMRRCMSNNYSLQQFWRDWHCSYNRWLVRYVYVPLGGRRTSSWNVFVVFTFVALWHDLTLRLLQWAWIIALLFLPEGLATWYFARPQWAARPYFRFLCSAGGALNIMGMMAANLVGFGDAGVDKMLAKIFCREGAVFLAAAYAALNAHLQVMFELREHEYRREYRRRARDLRPAEVEMAPRPAASDPSAASSGASSPRVDPAAAHRTRSAAKRAAS